MNNYASFILPSVSTNNTSETNESIPILPTAGTTTRIVSQSQTTSEPSSSIVCTSSSSNSNTNDRFHNSPSSLLTTQPSTNNTPRLVLLHHEDTHHFVLPSYCCPTHTSESNSVSTTPQHVCNFKRDCVISRTKVYSSGQNMSNLSPTVFKINIVATSKKFNYGTIDTRLVSCFNKLCKHSDTKLPKCFHYACYKHMMLTQGNDEMNEIEYQGVSDNILDQVVGVNNIKELQEHLEGNTNKLIFPVCGKRCFNVVMANKNKNKPKGVSEYANSKCWDTDGNEVNRSSIKVLLDWLTTEENASNYFGGVNKKGQTSATRKEAYHHELRVMIKKENGK